MFKALIKAFTGRAGFLSSFLALSIIALTAAALLLSLPRIEQKLEDSAQTILSETLSDKDTLKGLSAEGRQILLEGEFEDAAGLSAKLKEIEGVRSVLVNGLEVKPVGAKPLPVPVTDSTTNVAGQQAEPGQTGEVPEVAGDVNAANDTGNAGLKLDESAVATDADEKSPEEVALIDQVSENDQLTAVGEPLAQPAPEAEENASDADQLLDQSSLTLRYDGKQLSLSGHLADEQMAQLIAERVAHVIPAGSELETNLDGNGKGSPLNWMREFLATVSDLPDDAQGVIEGSDALGVQIIPDLEQTLAVQPPVPAVVPEDVPEIQDPEIQDVASSPESVSANLEESVTDEPVMDESGQPESPPDSSLNMPLEASQASESVEPEAEQAPLFVPATFITELNARVAGQPLFAPGEFVIGEALAAELDRLAEMMRQHPGLLLKIVGNLDFSVGPRDARFVGIDRAREIRSYLAMQQIEPYRIFATPLPGDSAFDQRIQVVFYISE
jgi:outer membrane protein OmpA-like peptidoglycan-associated protein